MTVEPPEPGDTGWADDLNAYLAYLEGRIAAVENKPEYVFSSYAWKYSAASPPAAAGELRFDNVDLTLVTQIDLRKIDGDGADRAPVFMQLTPGDTVRIHDWDDAAQIHRFTVTGPPMIGTTNVQIPVEWASGAGVLPTAGQAKINVGFLVSLIL